jgi:hypothetical protein
MSEYGFEDGAICGRDGCAGVIGSHDVENCSCHLGAPCGQCTSPKGFCPECDWEEVKEKNTNPPVSRWVNNTRITEVDVTVDATKLHYRSEPHSSCSMSKVGTYPDGMTIQQVRKEVNGTFGGRFDSFGDGKFRFIAYTD